MEKVNSESSILFILMCYNFSRIGYGLILDSTSMMQRGTDMNGKQITEEILRYLDDEYYRCAVLIDGEWGCGKTYFVMNDLWKAINEHENANAGRRLRYISLYGCRSVEEVEENIYCSIVDEKFYEKYEQITNIDNYHGSKKDQIEKNGRIITSISRKIVSTLMQRLGISYKAYECVADFCTMDKNIFIFDDLERCDCSPNDILGYINDLVEHEGAKVILVANEKEIGTLEEVGKKELQYMVAANGRINVPQEESIFSYGRTGNSKPELDIEELERRRRKLFATVEYNQQYKRIREKLIGQTLKYETDFVSVIHTLICNSRNNDELKKTLNGSVNNFINTMEEYGHKNLRTFQFFLSRMEFLYEQYREIGVDEKYYQPALDFLTVNCFMLCVEYKGDVQEPEEHFAQIRFQNKRRIKAVKEYIECSLFDQECYTTEINAYVATELSNHLPSDDPYSLLYNEYYMRTQKWVEDKIWKVLEKLEKNDYKFNIYSKMLVIFVQLTDLGFPEEILSKAEEYMIGNAKGENAAILDSFVASENPKVIEKCTEIIKKINSEVRSTKENLWQTAVRDIMENEVSWAKELYAYWNENEQNMPHNIQLLSSVDADTWADRILGSDAGNINDLRIFLSVLYPDNVYKTGVDADMDVIDAVMEKLADHEEEDLIKRAQLNWLKNELDQISRRNRSK